MQTTIRQGWPMRPNYSAHEILVAPARSRTALWRLPAALLTIMALQIGGLYAISLLGSPVEWFEDRLLAYLRMVGVDEVILNQTSTIDDVVVGFVFLSVFVLVFVNILIASMLWFHRGLTSLMGPWPRTLTQAARAAAGLVGLGLVLQFAPMGEAVPRSSGLPLELWQALLPLAVLVLLIQVSAEELLFRGLFQSQLAARFASPLIWMGVPTLLFTLGHIDPSLGPASAALILAYIFVYALSLADITARSGSLGPAIVMHFFNNFNVLLLVSPLGQLDGLALYNTELSLTDASALAAYAPIQIGATLMAWGVVRLALWR